MARTESTIVPELDRPARSARRRSSPLLLLGAGLVGLVVITALVSFFWTPFPVIFADTNHFTAGPGVGGHLLGTDTAGRDVATQLMAGARTTLYVGIVAVGIAAVVGTPLGIAAGMARGRLSELLLRLTDVWLAFPALLLALIFATVFGSSLTSAMTAIGIASIPGFVRVIRSGTVVVINSDFVTSAWICGRGNFGVAFRHVLPNVAGLVIVQCTVSYAIAILAEAALSYLNLGAGALTPSWGRMLLVGQPLITIHPLLVILPGSAIALAVLGFNLLGDGLRDRLDPRLRDGEGL